MMCRSRGTLQGPIGEGLHAFAAWDCRRWACERCGPRKATRYRIAITRRAEEHKLQRFVTLTLDPANMAGEEWDKLSSDEKREQSLCYLRDTWNKFRVLLGRKFSGAIPFIAVVEFQQSGFAHLHVLINQTINQQWLSDAWSSVGGGKIVKIKFVDVHRVSAYLSKYLTKEMLREEAGKKKRISTSRSIRLLDKLAGWKSSPLPLSYYHRRHSQDLITQIQTDDRGVRWFVLMITTQNATAAIVHRDDG